MAELNCEVERVQPEELVCDANHLTCYFGFKLIHLAREHLQREEIWTGRKESCVVKIISLIYHEGSYNFIEGAHVFFFEHERSKLGKLCVVPQEGVENLVLVQSAVRNVDSVAAPHCLPHGVLVHFPH